MLIRGVDKFFSLLPFIFICYHCFKMIYSLEHFYILVKLTINYFLSFILKHVFKQKRREKNYDFKKWTIPQKLRYMECHYSLPSSHTMFFIKYYFIKPTMYTLLIGILGSATRIFFQHHTSREVLATFLFVIGLEMILMYIFDI
ncbi:hypothetical protein NUSPORA_00769 [Nucleospora cyclopteri]